MFIMGWQTLPVQGLMLSGPGSQAARRVSVGSRSREGEKKEAEIMRKDWKKNLDI